MRWPEEMVQVLVVKAAKTPRNLAGPWLGNTYVTAPELPRAICVI